MSEIRMLRMTGLVEIRTVTLALIALLTACRAQPAPVPASAPPQVSFWAALQSICGRAYAGRLVEGNASDSAFRTSELRMHVRSCTPTEIRIPFHLGENRSRTWVITRTETGLRLKHDHRHQDGSADPITQYGGHTRNIGTSTKQEFYADAHTATLIPAARTNVWTIEIQRLITFSQNCNAGFCDQVRMLGDRFVYTLRREGTDRRFRVEFDLTKPIAAPPPPWGVR